MVKRFVVARQEGFEPPTLWFVARYSIQLSYWRISATVILYHFAFDLSRGKQKFFQISAKIGGEKIRHFQQKPLYNAVCGGVFTKSYIQ